MPFTIVPIPGAQTVPPDTEVVVAGSGHAVGLSGQKRAGQKRVGQGAGRLADDLSRGDDPCVDPRPFQHDRMIDGTDMDAPSLV